MLRNKKKIVVAGHICLDITPKFPANPNSNLSEILLPGKLVQMRDADVHTGGVVANTGLALNLFGADVNLIGKIGQDEFGKLILNILSSHMDTQHMLVANDTNTSYTIVLSPPGMDRTFLHNPGANDTFTFEDLTMEAIREATLFHFGYPPLMKRMYENDGEQLIRMFKTVKSLGVATSLDMAAVDPHSQAGTADWETILRRVLPYVDIFVPSVEELCFMIDRERYRDWQQRAGGRDIIEILSITGDVKPLADKLLEMGAQVMLLKCGALGLYYRAARQDIFIEISIPDLCVPQWAELERFEESYIPDRVVSATGAGDTSIAAFLYAMLHGYSLKQSLQLAAATGASCVTAFDPLSGLMTIEELLKKIDGGWKKQKV
ncbi:Sugar or nucleoside kinase, ribokinase family [Paenibacillus sp. CF095]|uniref:carbohydrate kinase family protein n=1 Tax=Paenibacillus sp. CF095 TaxID=1881033 RepID=UPI00088201D4|nr:carbohydrate kinase family protein [Paenibacillus sp. CF095]SDD54192.1 Sugar or nucleoside kinase, ribokinase family [Paenibacillus sp. CF095]